MESTAEVRGGSILKEMLYGYLHISLLSVYKGYYLEVSY